VADDYRHFRIASIVRQAFSVVICGKSSETGVIEKPFRIEGPVGMSSCLSLAQAF
jgi:hypothetical protein